MGDASITEAQLNLHQKLGCIFIYTAWGHNLLKGVAIHLPYTIFKLDKTMDETSYAHHFLDILHTAMMKSLNSHLICDWQSVKIANSGNFPTQNDPWLRPGCVF